MEVCPETELIAIEDPATVCDGSFEIGERFEVLVGKRLVDNRPQVLGRLQLGGVARQVDEPETLGHDQVWRGVPAGVVEHKRDHALASRPGLTCRATRPVSPVSTTVSSTPPRRGKLSSCGASTCALLSKRLSQKLSHYDRPIRGREVKQLITRARFTSSRSRYASRGPKLGRGSGQAPIGFLTFLILKIRDG